MRRLLLSFDISTTNVGIALWNMDGVLLELKHLALKTNKSVLPEDRDIVKAEIFKTYVEEYMNKLNESYGGVAFTNLFVEAPIPSTSININTTALLLGFNGMCTYNLYDLYKIIPKRITVHESRKIFCKEFIVQKKIKGELVETLSFPKGWKSEDKKLYIQKKVKALEPQVEWFYKKKSKELDETSYDMSDAYAVGIAGMVINNILSTEEWNRRCENLKIK